MKIIKDILNDSLFIQSVTKKLIYLFYSYGHIFGTNMDVVK